jgi:hypothetical protein
MKIFVLGSSGVGKTPFARHIAEAFGVPHISASAWVRELFPAQPPADRAAFVEAITRFATAHLRARPDACVTYLRSHHDLERPCVIEGVRNPYDFIHLFDPREDRVVFLTFTGDHLSRTLFERGLEVIEAYLNYLVDTGLIGTQVPVLRYSYGRLYAAPEGEPPVVGGGPDRLASSLDQAIADAIGEFRRLALFAPPAEAIPAVRPQRVHAAVPPLRVHVRAEYLYDMDPSHKGELVPATVFAVSSYAGHAQTFQVLVGDGGLFSYLPPTALVDPAKRREPELELEDLVYSNCAPGPICVHRFEALAGPMQAYFRRRDLWLAGTYQWTLDWYEDNRLAHLIALENGQFALLPSHKVKFGDTERSLPPYRKLHAEWKV